jgi:hypothetical protein
MTSIDFFTTITQIAMALFMITMLALRKNLTPPLSIRPVRIRDRVVIDRRDPTGRF